MDEKKVSAMREGGKIMAQIFADLKEFTQPGKTGKEIDKWVEQQILAAGAGDNTDWKAAFMGLLDNTLVGDVVVADGVTKIKDYCFDRCSGLTSITLPNTITEISPYAFRYCTGLTEIEIPASAEIKNNAFERCSNLVRVTTQGGFGNIGSRAFGDCSKLEEFEFNDTVTEVSKWCFIGCSSLKYIELPASLTNIYSQAFYSCSSLGYILIKATTPPTLDSAALPAEIASIFVPDASVDTYKAATRWSDVAAKIRPISLGESAAITTQSNPEVMVVCYEQGLSTSENQILVKECNKATSLQVSLAFNGSDIVNFEEFAYFGLSNRFNGTDGAFRDCAQLERVVFPPTAVQITSQHLFSGCTQKPIVVFTSPTMVSTNGNGVGGFESNTSAIYVPDSLVATYKANGWWSRMAAKIFPISDYTWQNLAVKNYLGL